MTNLIVMKSFVIRRQILKWIEVSSRLGRSQCTTVDGSWSIHRDCIGKFLVYAYCS